MNISQEQIKQEIRILIESKIANCNIGYDDELKKHGISSIQIIEIVIDIEEKYKIEFNQGNLTEDMLKSINAISCNVITLLSKKDISL